MKTTNKPYESPQAELIEVETQGVLCASAPAASTGAGVGTTNMNMDGNTYGW